MVLSETRGVGELKIRKKMYVLYGQRADTVKGRALGRDTIIVDQVDGSYSEAAAGMN